MAIDPELYKKIVQSAAREKVSISEWMTDAARNALRPRAGLAAIEQWEKEHGRFTAAEMDAARRRVRAELRAPGKLRRSAWLRWRTTQPFS